MYTWAKLTVSQLIDFITFPQIFNLNCCLRAKNRDVGIWFSLADDPQSKYLSRVFPLIATVAMHKVFCYLVFPLLK